MKAQTMRRLRQYHLYLGMLFAPAIIFFALSGMLQTIGLHEDHTGKTTPPRWIVWMASVHKDQALPHARRPRPVVPSPAPAAEHHDHEEGEGESSVILLKGFVLLLAIGLIASSLLGIAIALGNRATRRRSAVMLAIGVALPLVLLFV